MSKQSSKPISPASNISKAKKKKKKKTKTLAISEPTIAKPCSAPTRSTNAKSKTKKQKKKQKNNNNNNLPRSNSSTQQPPSITQNPHPSPSHQSTQPAQCPTKGKHKKKNPQSPKIPTTQPSSSTPNLQPLIPQDKSTQEKISSKQIKEKKKKKKKRQPPKPPTAQSCPIQQALQPLLPQQVLHPVATPNKKKKAKQNNVQSPNRPSTQPPATAQTSHPSLPQQASRPATTPNKKKRTKKNNAQSPNPSPRPPSSEPQTPQPSHLQKSSQTIIPLSKGKAKQKKAQSSHPSTNQPPLITRTPTRTSTRTSTPPIQPQTSQAVPLMNKRKSKKQKLQSSNTSTPQSPPITHTQQPPPLKQLPDTVVPPSKKKNKKKKVQSSKPTGPQLSRAPPASQSSPRQQSSQPPPQQQSSHTGPCPSKKKSKKKKVQSIKPTGPQPSRPPPASQSSARQQSSRAAPPSFNKKKNKKKAQSPKPSVKHSAPQDETSGPPPPQSSSQGSTPSGRRKGRSCGQSPKPTNTRPSATVQSPRLSVPRQPLQMVAPATKETKNERKKETKAAQSESVKPSQFEDTQLAVARSGCPPSIQVQTSGARSTERKASQQQPLGRSDGSASIQVRITETSAKKTNAAQITVPFRRRSARLKELRLNRNPRSADASVASSRSPGTPRRSPTEPNSPCTAKRITPVKRSAGELLSQSQNPETHKNQPRKKAKKAAKFSTRDSVDVDVDNKCNKLVPSECTRQSLQTFTLGAHSCDAQPVNRGQDRVLASSDGGCHGESTQYHQAKRFQLSNRTPFLSTQHLSGQNYLPVQNTTICPISPGTQPQCTSSQEDRQASGRRTVRHNPEQNEPTMHAYRGRRAGMPSGRSRDWNTQPQRNQSHLPKDVEMGDMRHHSAQARPSSTVTKRNHASLATRNGCLTPQSLPPSKRPRCDQAAQPLETAFVTPQTSSGMNCADPHVSREQARYGSMGIPTLPVQNSQAPRNVRPDQNIGQGGRAPETPKKPPRSNHSRNDISRATEDRRFISKKHVRRNSMQKKTISPTGEYFGIRCGRDGFSGVLTCWTSCSYYVLGYRDAVYGMFDTWEKAEEFADRDGVGASLNYRSNYRHFFSRRKNGTMVGGSLAQLPWELENEPKVVSLVTGAAWLRFGIGSGIGGYSVFISEHSPYNYAGLMEGNVTEFRLHLKATLEALEIVHQHRLVKDGGVVEIYTISEDVKNGIDHWLGRWDRTGQWTRHGEAVGSQDLWRAILSVREELQKKGTRIQMIWVRGPAGVAAVQRATNLARLCFGHMEEGEHRNVPSAT